MNNLNRFGVSIDAKLLKEFDEQIEKIGYSTRSKAIGDLINTFIVSKRWEEDELIAGAITMLYDHHNKEMLTTVMDMQHDYYNIIISTQHVHLDHDNCLEIIAVKGNSNRIKELYEKLKSTKSVAQCNISITSAP